MRKGQAWPNSGGRTMVGNSGVRVSVRSTMRILPDSSSDMNWPRTEVVMVVPSEGCVLMWCFRFAWGAWASGAQFPFQRLGVVGQAGAELLRHVAHVGFFDAFLQGAD